MNLCPLATGFPEQLSADNLAIMALMMTTESVRISKGITIRLSSCVQNFLTRLVHVNL